MKSDGQLQANANQERPDLIETIEDKPGWEKIEISRNDISTEVWEETGFFDEMDALTSEPRKIQVCRTTTADSWRFEIFTPEGNKEIKKLKSAVVKRINDLRPKIYKKSAKFYEEEQTIAHLQREIQVKFSFRKLNKNTVQLVMLSKHRQEIIKALQILNDIEKQVKQQNQPQEDEVSLQPQDLITPQIKP